MAKAATMADSIDTPFFLILPIPGMLVSSSDVSPVIIEETTGASNEKTNPITTAVKACVIPIGFIADKIKDDVVIPTEMPIIINGRANDPAKTLDMFIPFVFIFVPPNSTSVSLSIAFNIEAAAGTKK